MALIEARKNKDGKVTSYRITVADGLDSTGKQIRHRKTWTPAPGMTPAKIKRELNRVAVAFEQSVLQGFQLDNQQTFQSYAEYVLTQKERAGIKPRTLDEYRKLLPRINRSIGHLKLVDIRPQHLNNFYAELERPGENRAKVRAVATPKLAAAIAKQGLDQEALAQKAGVGVRTVREAEHGNTIMPDCAKKIADALQTSYSAVFKETGTDAYLSARSVRAYHGVISLVLSTAEKEMLVPYNAARKASPPKQTKPKPIFYQPEEIAAIWDALDTEPLKWQVITHLLIVTGCRRGEIMGLKWDKVDFATRMLTIDTALLYTKSKGVYDSTPKTERTRHIILPEETMGLLRRWQAAQMELRLFWGESWVDSGYVFTRDTGERMNPSSVTGWLSKFSKRHGLPHIHPHALRHTVASVMIENGIDVVTVAGQLGHADASTTERIYAHELELSRTKASDCIAEVLLRKKQA